MEREAAAEYEGNWSTNLMDEAPNASMRYEESGAF